MSNDDLERRREDRRTEELMAQLAPMRQMMSQMFGDLAPQLGTIHVEWMQAGEGIDGYTVRVSAPAQAAESIPQLVELAEKVVQKLESRFNNA